MRKRLTNADIPIGMDPHEFFQLEARDALLARVQKATGFDRALDVDLLVEIGGYRDVHGDRSLFDRGNDGYWSLDGDEQNPPLPSPTSSIDDALAFVACIVPEHHDWQFGYLSLIKGRQHYAHLYATYGGGFWGTPQAYGSNLPLAILAAALALKPTKRDACLNEVDQ